VIPLNNISTDNIRHHLIVLTYRTIIDLNIELYLELV